jgi:hypothetical protein
MGGRGDVDLPRLLQVAPQLRQISWCESPVSANKALLDKLLSPGSCSVDPALDGLFHPRLRSIMVKHEVGFNDNEVLRRTPSADCAKVLRRRRFPRLRHLTLNGVEYCNDCIK